MIWFSCKQCGKVHGRAENSIGATIFCECGQGIVVPWESTVEEPKGPPVPPPLSWSPPPLKLEPVVFEPPPARPGPPPPGRRRGRRAQRDPQFCFNHQEVPQQAACADCGENFCLECLVSFQGQSLCAPCKNYRVRLLQRTQPAPRFALLSVSLALLTGPVALCLLPISQRGFPWAALLALVPQLVALVLGSLAWRAADQENSPGGRSLAITGVVTAALTSVVIVLLALHAPSVS